VEKLIQDLNEKQREAVLFNEGPSLIIAGAGSGKTRVLTYKIAVLLKTGVLPWTVMALTFTNKAAREMKERVGQLVDPHAASRLWMGTFHSVFLRILRSEAEHIGFPVHFTIYDTADSKNLIKSLVKELGLDDKVYKSSKVLGRISAAKNDLITPDAYANHPDYQINDTRSRMSRIKDLYALYWRRCREANAMDFDDILLYTNLLFRDHPEVLLRYQEHFSHILVDEYQDTNFSQYLIVKRLAERHHRVCVVGDDSQSIYSFRGANIDNILNFKKHYPESRLFKLEQNYRSTQNIVNLANSLIAKNRGQIPKQVFSKNELGNRIQVMTAYSDLEEGNMVAARIGEMRLSTHESFNDFAILYRTNAQSRIFEESLRKRNLPYRIYGGLSFYQRKEIKDVISYLRFLLNPNDVEAFRRIINNPPRGIGDTTQQKVLTAMRDHQVGVHQILESPETYELPINSGTRKKLADFQELIESLRRQSTEDNVYELTKVLLSKTGLMKAEADQTDLEAQSRRDNLMELLTGMYNFCNDRLEQGIESVFIADYLSEVSLLTDQDEEKSNEGERVTLMTIHASKGLEFKHVFIVGLEEDIFPSGHSLDSDKAIEEERRLLYVAITRAESTCTISYAKSRFRNGQTNYSSPSRFLNDLDTRLLDVPQQIPTASRTVRANPVRTEPTYSPKRNLTRLHSSSNPSDAPSTSTVSHGSNDLRIGQSILHERFGKGQILGFDGSEGSSTMTVEFEHSGSKRLLLKFAKFTLLD
jgi:DNA helicase-2/ATP-dependent DNA helicase PcrA